jgi:hypothetical protein
MDCNSGQLSRGRVWALAARQHGVVARRQLLELGLHRQAITHRIARGRLHPTAWRGVYAVGRPELSRHGVLMAAALAGGPDAVLSHRSAAELWEIRTHQMEVSRSRLRTDDVVTAPGSSYTRGLDWRRVTLRSTAEFR